MGYGVIGQGCAEVLRRNACVIAENAGEGIELKRILDLRDFPGDANEALVTHDFNDILNDGEISVVIETMGGKGAAYRFTKALLEAGKSVVSSNKELVAYYGDELLSIAEAKGVSYRFEASTGGGIPIITPLSDSLAANDITEIRGIVNGTSNYILTEMQKGGSFEAALREAQAKGYAEADPTADVEGIDACRKICILAAMAFGTLFSPESVETQGISKITPEDIRAAEDAGCAIKLIASAKKDENGRIALSVRPERVPPTDMLYNVSGVYNGISVYGNAVDCVFFYGPGAGSLPTASAVIGDVVRIAKGEGSYKSAGRWTKV